jgi:hypothetical protein
VERLQPVDRSVRPSEEPVQRQPQKRRHLHVAPVRDP